MKDRLITLLAIKALPDSSILLDSSGRVCEIAEYQYTDNEIDFRFLTTGSEEDYPLDQISLPATLVRRGR